MQKDEKKKVSRASTEYQTIVQTICVGTQSCTLFPRWSPKYV